MTLRGIDLIAAVTLIAELGDLRRFAHPKQLMAFLGLVPSECSTGETRSLGSITKAGNSLARRVLIEAAWAYRFPAKIAREMQVRNGGRSGGRPWPHRKPCDRSGDRDANHHHPSREIIMYQRVH